ncbi:hypothetical protein CYMTET_39680 [Cymbomonas tetramitiformis]|uniref:Uncharacterized protein n=1 Tax=Cymbomonas tetramitiformis TaxID=36881 RepID=A0AAE0CB14_9CHLO|nr:hypothetical protein CYMTET_39680 [Cymbomonas tetramitiformis]
MLSKSEADVTQEDTLTPSLNLPDKARGTSSRKFQDILHRIMNKEHDKSSDTLQALLRGNILGQTSYVPACPTVSDDADSVGVPMFHTRSSFITRDFGSQKLLLTVAVFSVAKRYCKCNDSKYVVTVAFQDLLMVAFHSLGVAVLLEEK